MRTRNVIRLAVVAAVSLFILYAPTDCQVAKACPYSFEYDVEYWDDPYCTNSNPPVCEQVEPRMFGKAHFYCDGTLVCLQGTCDESMADRVVVRGTRWCPLCGDEEP
jgi:hypothetical protein